MNEIRNKINKGVNEAAGKVIGKEEKPQRNNFLMKMHYKIKRELKTKRLTEMADIMNKNIRIKRKKHMKYLDRKREYCLNQSSHKWKLLIITRK
jgi:hypothetical protein